MNIKVFLTGIQIVVAAAAFGARAFEKVPDEARTALKGTRGKPTRTGFVFINGHYIKPPYIVARYGTAIFINNEQITDQIVPWRSFLATQPGAAAAAQATKPATPAPAKKSSSIDDLFDDDSAPAKGTSAQPAAAAASDGAFVGNDRSKALVKKINEVRTDINKRLRNGQAFFFGAGHAPVAVPARLTRDLIAILPDEMRDAADGADLAARMRAKGFVFLGPEVCNDLIENRADYPMLVERIQQMKEDENIQNLLKGSQGKTK